MTCCPGKPGTCRLGTENCRVDCRSAVTKTVNLGGLRSVAQTGGGLGTVRESRKACLAASYSFLQLLYSYGLSRRLRRRRRGLARLATRRTQSENSDARYWVSWVRYGPFFFCLVFLASTKPGVSCLKRYVSETAQTSASSSSRPTGLAWSQGLFFHLGSFAFCIPLSYALAFPKNAIPNDLSCYLSLFSERMHAILVLIIFFFASFSVSLTLWDELVH